MAKKINHIGIVGKEFDHDVEVLKSLGFACTKVSEAKDVGAKIAFFTVGETVFEYLAFGCPSGMSDPLINVITSQKGPMNHICIEVDDLDKTVEEFETKGARLVDGCPRTGPHGRIAFFYPGTTAGVLIELLEI
jgi:methylmalonyl-CoA epimerase